jgi:hypothetical protein
MPNFSRLQSFQNLEKIGIELIPVLYQYSDANFNNIYEYKTFISSCIVGSLYSEISRTKGSADNDPWCGEVLGYMWFGGEKLCRERFNILYVNLESSRKEKDSITKLRVLKAIRSMGIFALPFLIESIKKGDEDMIPIICNMFHKELANANKEKILEWFEKNQNKYTLPEQHLEKCRNRPPLSVINRNYSYLFLEKFELLYHEWNSRNIVQGEYSVRETSIESVALAKLIGIENTPQFHFLVDLGEEALPYLFLKLKEEKEQFTLPVIEKIMDKKLSPEEVKQHIEEAEQLLNKAEPIVMREWTTQNGKFSIEAKYISSKDEKVTLEKANGSIITVEIPKLSTKDQDYIKRQQTTEKTKYSK